MWLFDLDTLLVASVGCRSLSEGCEGLFFVSGVNTPPSPCLWLHPSRIYHIVYMGVFLFKSVQKLYKEPFTHNQTYYKIFVKCKIINKAIPSFTDIVYFTYLFWHHISKHLNIILFQFVFALFYFISHQVTVKYFSFLGRHFFQWLKQNIILDTKEIFLDTWPLLAEPLSMNLDYPWIDFRLNKLASLKRSLMKLWCLGNMINTDK